MATLPLAFQATFEDGTIGSVFTETDTDSKLAVRHYSELARLPYVDSIPYKGAYAAHINLSLGTADAYLEAATGFDAAATTTVAMRFYFWASQLTMAALDRFTIASLESAAGTGEATISVYCPAVGQFQFVTAETGAIAVGDAKARAVDLIQNEWHCLELVSVIDAGGGNDGTLAFYLDGYQIGATVTALDQAAIVHARFGAIGIDAGTTRGHLLFDQIAGDTARVGPLKNRFRSTRLLTQSGHAVLGPAGITSASLFANPTPDETMQLYDTDTADTLDLSNRIVISGEQWDATYVRRGLYVVLTGTNPLASIEVSSASDMSVAGIKNLGLKRVL